MPAFGNAAATSDHTDVTEKLNRLSLSQDTSDTRTTRRKPIDGQPQYQSNTNSPVVERQSLDNASPTVRMVSDRNAKQQSVQNFSRGHTPTTSSASNPYHDKRALEQKTGTDLSKTAETIVHETVAPAVTHEVVRQQFLHLQEEQITKEIHTHQVLHRIQPIVDVQVLPAKHFIPSPDGKSLIPITEDQIPGRIANKQNWVIAETVSKQARGQSKDVTATGPRQFTARTFGKEDNDVPEYVDQDGVRRSKTTWIHSPTVEDGGRRTGQTVPLHLP